VLASSSAGNCTFVRAGRTRILIDAGLSRKETAARLALIGEDLAAIDAILITHEHSDHIAGLPVLAKHLPCPIFATPATAAAIDFGAAQPNLALFDAGTRFHPGDITVDSFTLPHDAADPVGYTLRGEGIKIGVVTDLGYLPDSIKVHLGATHCLVLESNHDIEMLKVGPYPWSVKQRVLGRKGHLSNDAAGEYLSLDLPGEIQTLLLGHLSEHNNHPALAEQSARQALARRGLAPRLEVLLPRRQSPVFEF
jgi:phosphoribosyl 1,2-cyclic phosphodiesterase